MKVSKSCSGNGVTVLVAFVISVCLVTVTFGQVNDLPDANSTSAGDAESITIESINIGPPVAIPLGVLRVTPEEIYRIYIIGPYDVVRVPTYDDSEILSVGNTGLGGLNWHATCDSFFTVVPDAGYLYDFDTEIVTVYWDIPSASVPSSTILFESNRGVCTVEIRLEVIEMDDSSEPSDHR